MDSLARRTYALQNSEGPGGVEIWFKKKFEKIFKKSGSNSKIIASI
jgi:hypothetical protein